MRTLWLGCRGNQFALLSSAAACNSSRPPSCKHASVGLGLRGWVGECRGAVPHAAKRRRGEVQKRWWVGHRGSFCHDSTVHEGAAAAHTLCCSGSQGGCITKEGS